jgi:N-acetylmuramoyl-L-alanine amidase
MALVACLLFVLWNPAEATCRRSEYIVGIDIGHTQEQGGATSARGVPEFHFNAQMAHVLRARLLEAGFSSVVLINADGTIDSLISRPQQANAIPVNLFLSIHHDSVQPKYLSTWEYAGKTLSYSDHFRGFSIFVSRKNGAAHKSIAFAKHLGEALLAKQFTPTLHHAEPIPGENRELLDKRRGIYFFDDLVVLKKAQVPAVLLECGVIKHRDEEIALRDAALRQSMADAIVMAIDSFCAEAS